MFTPHTTCMVGETLFIDVGSSLKVWCRIHLHNTGDDRCEPRLPRPHVRGIASLAKWRKIWICDVFWLGPPHLCAEKNTSRIQNKRSLTLILFTGYRHFTLQIQVRQPWAAWRPPRLGQHFKPIVCSTVGVSENLDGVLRHFCNDINAGAPELFLFVVFRQLCGACD